MQTSQPAPRQRRSHSEAASIPSSLVPVQGSAPSTSRSRAHIERGLMAASPSDGPSASGSGGNGGGSGSSSSRSSRKSKSPRRQGRKSKSPGRRSEDPDPDTIMQGRAGSSDMPAVPAPASAAPLLSHDPRRAISGPAHGIVRHKGKRGGGVFTAESESELSSSSSLASSGAGSASLSASSLSRSGSAPLGQSREETKGSMRQQQQESGQPRGTSDLVKFNVGGMKYITTKTTLFSQGSNFLTMLIENDAGNGVPCVRDDEGYVFIDRNGDAFSVVLDFLRSGRILEHPKVSLQQLRHEFDFYQIALPSYDEKLYEDDDEFLARRLSTGLSTGCQKLKQSSMASTWKEQARQWVEENIRLIEEVMVDYTNQGYIDCKLFSHWNTTPEAYHLHLGTKLTTPLPGAVLGNRIWWMYATRWLQQQYENKLIATYSRQELYLNWAGVLLPDQSHSQFATLSSYGGPAHSQHLHQSALLQDLQHLAKRPPQERMSHSFTS